MDRQIRSTSPKTTNVGAKLRRLRRERRLTQAELARQIGIQQSDLSRIEKGEYRISLDNLFKVLGIFEIKMSEFFGEPAAASVAAASRPLAQEDMQILHLLRQLGPQGRREVMEFLEFKVRREMTERRAHESRRSESETG